MHESYLALIREFPLRKLNNKLYNQALAIQDRFKGKHLDKGEKDYLGVLKILIKRAEQDSDRNLMGLLMEKFPVQQP